jgi:hypothetical protein
VKSRENPGVKMVFGSFRNASFVFPVGPEFPTFVLNRCRPWFDFDSLLGVLKAAKNRAHIDCGKAV